MIKDKNVNINNVIQHLASKWGKNPCPICNTNNWAVSDQVYELKGFHGDDKKFSEVVPIFPVIPVTCNNCGNAVMVNALKAGAFDIKNELN